MNRLTINRCPVVTLRQRHPFRPLMGCWEQSHQPSNRRRIFCFIVKPNSGRAKVVMISSQPAMWICGKNRGCILFQYGTTQIKSHEILIRL